MTLSFRPQIYDESETDQILNAKYFVWKKYTLGKWGRREAFYQNSLMQLFNGHRRIVHCLNRATLFKQGCCLSCLGQRVISAVTRFRICPELLHFFFLSPLSLLLLLLLLLEYFRLLDSSSELTRWPRHDKQQPCLNSVARFKQCSTV